MEKTFWYPPEIKPVRPGLYETKSPILGYSPGWFSYWDGKKWGSAYPSVGKAHLERSSIAFRQDRPWRGLKKGK